MIDTLLIRNNYRAQSQKLARARRLYIFLSRHKFRTAGNDYFDYMTDVMAASGLYSKGTPAKMMRRGIINRLFKIEHPRFSNSSMVFREWLIANGIDSSSGYFKPIINRKVA